MIRRWTRLRPTSLLILGSVGLWHARGRAVVDPDNGEPNTHYVVSEDCGTMINPMIILRLKGGIAQGSAPRSMKRYLTTRSASRLATTFADYGAVRAGNS
jgi:CO/xanthine dehydrogenase Mo-binding subunit